MLSILKKLSTLNTNFEIADGLGMKSFTKHVIMLSLFLIEYFKIKKQVFFKSLLYLILLLVQNDFGPSQLFRSVPNHLVGSKSFGWVQIILVRFKLDFFDYFL